MQRGCIFKCTLIKSAMLSIENSVHYQTFCFYIIVILFD
nr:MAG TPA: hypothetical protein [Caudoviricetes sp.]